MKHLKSTLAIIAVLSLLTLFSFWKQSKKAPQPQPETSMSQQVTSEYPITSPQDLQNFSKDYVAVQKTDENKFAFTNNYACTEKYENAWYVYETENKNDPIYKTKYSADASFEYILPDPGKGYSVKVFIKNPSTGEKKSVWVAELPLNEAALEQMPFEDFSEAYVDARKIDGDKFLLTNRFACTEEYENAWYVYEAENKNDPIYKTKYSDASSFEFELPDPNKRYAVKLFSKTKETDEKKTVWVADLPFSGEKLVRHPLEDFESSFIDIREVGENTYQLTNTFVGNVEFQNAWYVYDAWDKETPIHKTSYTSDPVFEYQLPDENVRYVVKVFLRNRETGEKVSAWTKELPLFRSEGQLNMADFSPTHIEVTQEGAGEYTLRNTFSPEGGVETVWCVYSAYDRDTPISKTKYSTDPTFTLRVPDENEAYVVKVYVRSTETGEQVSAMVKQEFAFKEPEQQEEEDAFSYRSIERVLLEDGYKFINHASGECGFRIYERKGSEINLVQTVPGKELIFTDIDPEKNYVLKAYMNGPSGEEEIPFYYLYSDQFKEMMLAAIQRVGAVEKIKTGLFKDYDVSLPVDWEFPEIVDRSDKSEIYSFHVFNDLLINYRDPGNAELFLEYAESFCNANPVVSVENEMNLIWADFSISRRVQSLATARIVLDHRIDNVLLTKIENQLRDCALQLENSAFYKLNHNHGMYQDRALLSYLSAFGYIESDEGQDYELAKERLKKYFEFALTEDGVHKEHSLGYHINIYENMLWFYDYFTAYGDNYAEYLGSLAHNMVSFVTDMTMPDFTLPPTGDSYRNVYLYVDRMAEAPEYEWIASKGKKGTMPTNPLAVYPDGGYGVMRTSWKTPAANSTYMLLTAATHSKAHKHQDDLNFILYHRGQLFVEAGKKDFNYSDPMTAYGYSSFAHNVLFVENQGWPMSSTNHPILDDAAYRTQITDWGQSDGGMWVSARSERWPTVMQDRTLRFDDNAHTAQVEDLLTATEEENIRLIYHIASDVEIEQTENGWNLRRDGNTVAEVAVEASGKAKLTTLRGSQTDGEFKTWLFDEKHTDEPLEGGLLMVDMTCTQGENRVALNINLIQETLIQRIIRVIKGWFA